MDLGTFRKLTARDSSLECGAGFGLKCCCAGELAARDAAFWMMAYWDACTDNAFADGSTTHMPETGSREARVKEAIRKVYQRRAVRANRAALALGATVAHVNAWCNGLRALRANWLAR